MQGHVTCRHKGSWNTCADAWCGLPLATGTAEDSSIHHAGADLGTIARSGQVVFTDEDTKP